MQYGCRDSIDNDRNEVRALENVGYKRPESLICDVENLNSYAQYGSGGPLGFDHLTTSGCPVLVDFFSVIHDTQ